MQSNCNLRSDRRATPGVCKKRIMIVGNPNVGKSVIFHQLTKEYVTVANYPGTTVEVIRGEARIGNEDYEVIDTPGLYSLSPISEEERVARSILLKESPYLILHIVDAKNLERMLPLTLELLIGRFAVILVLNMIDEAEKAGIEIDAEQLERELGIPVVKTTATVGRGIGLLKRRIGEKIGDSNYKDYELLPGQKKIERLLSPITRGNGAKKIGALSLFSLREDSEYLPVLIKDIPKLENLISIIKQEYPHPLEYEIRLRLLREAQMIVNKVIKETEIKRVSLRERLSRLTINPWTGIPILLLILYFGLYKFVGGFGAGTVVDFLETKVFENGLNPFFIKIFTTLIPLKTVSDLLVGEYGLITLGLRYALAIILPIVTFFFLIFSVIEDSGYLPRLALLIDRLFKKIGLSGRAVIPMVLGLGCDTMATMVTRTLPTKRERVIATLLLALAVPCSAQLGVILAILSGNSKVLLIWLSVVGLIFLSIGFLAAKVMPGERPIFYLELPPLRLPMIKNTLLKTFIRVKWYIKEVIPLFLLASVIIWLGQLSGFFQILVSLLSYPVNLIGLPDEAAKIFLFGFLRRDYGAAGLYDLSKLGLLSGVQLATACIALTLFLPCIAQFIMNVKERGFKTGIAISVFILFFSFIVAFLVNLILTSLKVSI